MKKMLLLYLVGFLKTRSKMDFFRLKRPICELKIGTYVGSTLVEILIVLGVLALISSTTMNLMEYGLRGQKQVELSSEINNLTLGIQLALSQPQTCTCNLVNKTFDPANLATQTIPLNSLNQASSTCVMGSSIAHVSLTNPGKGLWITEMQIKNISQVDSSHYFATLHLEIQKVLVGGGPLGSQFTTRKFHLNLVTVANGSLMAIQTCTGGFAGGGTGPVNGTVDGQTLRWNAGATLWEPTGDVGFNTGLFTATTSSTTPTLVTKQEGSSTMDLFQAQDSSGASLVKITSSGKVGIGTASPTSTVTIVKNMVVAPHNSGTITMGVSGPIGTTPMALYHDSNDVSNSSYLGFENIDGSSGNIGASVHNAVGTLKIMANVGKQVALSANGSMTRSDLLISTNGKVAIGNSAGTSAPNATLHIIGPTFDGGPASHSLWVGNSGSATGAVAIGYDPTPGIDIGYVFAGNTAVGYRPLVLNRNGGNVGIGQTNPAPNAALHIVGPTFDGGPASHSLWVGNAGSTTGAVAIGYDPTPGIDTGYIFAGNTAVGYRPLVLNRNGGNVGIGIPNPSFTLHVAGTAGLSTGTAWTSASDIRLKDIRGNYEYGLKEILKLQAVRFNYKKDNPMGLPSDHPMTGFIAQEVQEVIPEAVKENKNSYLELNVDPIHWAMVNAVKELYVKIIDLFQRKDEHSSEIAILKAENVSLRADFALLKSENLLLKAYLCGNDPGATFCQ